MSTGMVNPVTHGGGIMVDTAGMAKEYTPSDYADRLQQAIDSSKVTVREIAQRLGVTTQAIYKVLRGETRALQASHHLAACKVLGVEPRWLADGVGPMHTPRSIPLVGNPDYPAIRRVRLQFDAGVHGYRVDQIDEPDVDPLVFRAAWFRTRGYTPERLVAVGVSGSSMEPTLYDGDTVVLNLADVAPKDAEVYGIRYEDQLVLKRLFREGGTWWMHSDNPDVRRYPRRELSADAEIIGRVVHRQSERI